MLFVIIKINLIIVVFFGMNVHVFSLSLLAYTNLREILMNKALQTELEAAAFRHLVSHLQQHTEIQNIDLMITADFCRNCLAKWYAAAALEQGAPLDYEQAREIIYGMPYNDWKDKFQQESTSEQLAAYKQRQEAKN